MTAPHTQCQPDKSEPRHTATPWRVFTNPDGTKLVGIGAQDGEGILDCGFGVWAWDDPAGIANANLVVEAVNSHAALKSRVEELTKALDELQDAEQAYRMCHDLDGDGHINTGRAWDKMRRAGRRARSMLPLEDRR